MILVPKAGTRSRMNRSLAHAPTNRMLKKSTSGVLGPLSCSRTPCTLRRTNKGRVLRNAESKLWPCWTGLFEHPALLLM